MRRLSLALLAALLPALAAAQGAVTATADLDGAGAADRFVLGPPDDNVCRSLTITTRGGATIDVPQFICGLDPDGAAMEAMPNGSLRLTGTHYGIGRDKWELTLTLVSRNGAIRVGGYTFRWHDALDPDGWGTCDLNLLTGRGTLATARGTTDVTASIPALPVTAWKDDPSLPECDPPGEE